MSNTLVNVACPVALKCDNCPLKEKGKCENGIIRMVELENQPKEEKKDKLVELLNKHNLSYHVNQPFGENGSGGSSYISSDMKPIAEKIWEFIEKEIVPSYHPRGCKDSSFCGEYNLCIKEIEERIRKARGL